MVRPASFERDLAWRLAMNNVTAAAAPAAAKPAASKALNELVLSSSTVLLSKIAGSLSCGNKFLSDVEESQCIDQNCSDNIHLVAYSGPQNFNVATLFQLFAYSVLNKVILLVRNVEESLILECSPILLATSVALYPRLLSGLTLKVTSARSTRLSVNALGSSPNSFPTYD